MMVIILIIQLATYLSVAGNYEYYMNVNYVNSNSWVVLHNNSTVVHTWKKDVITEYNSNVVQSIVSCSTNAVFCIDSSIKNLHIPNPNTIICL